MSTADPPTLSASERLARIIDGLCKAVAARGVGGRLTSALLILLWNRLRRAAIRIRCLDARIVAGATLVPRHRPATTRPARKPPPHLPRGYAWLVRWAPAAAACGSQLQFLLDEPEMAALAAAPPMRRLLRPLCRMLGVPLPPVPPCPAGTMEPQPSAADPPPPPARHAARDRRRAQASPAVPRRPPDDLVAA